MAFDRFIYWRKKRPSWKALDMVLRDYVRGLGRVRWNNDRWICTLHGRRSDALQRILSRRRDRLARFYVRVAHDSDSRERWFEVHWGVNNIDVITRQTDEVTTAIADAFAVLCLRFWQASDSSRAVADELFAEARSGKKPRGLLDTHVSLLPLSIRAIDCLQKNHVETIRGLIRVMRLRHTDHGHISYAFDANTIREVTGLLVELHLVSRTVKK